MKPVDARAIMRMRAGGEVGATRWMRSSPLDRASAARGPASSGGRSATMTPSTPASAAVPQKALRPKASTEL